MSDQPVAPKPSSLPVETLSAKSVPSPVKAPSAALIDASHDSRNPGSVIRFGWLVLLFGFFGLLAWAAWAPLDSGVTASGQIVVDSLRQKVQHLSGGNIEKIHVRDGSHVVKNQILIELNRTRPQAELEIVESQLISSLMIEARLSAERDQYDRLVFSEKIRDKIKQDSRVQEVANTQQKLFEARRSSLENELSILEESVAGMKQQLQGLEAQVSGKGQQLALLKEELNSLNALFKQGYVPRNRIFELERAIADTAARQSEDRSNIGRIKAALGELRLRKVQRAQEFRKEVESQLTSVQRDVNSLEQKHIALQDELNRIKIRTPVNGVVVNMQVHSEGGVIRPGEDILEIVPDGEPLVVEVKVPVQFIELVHSGLSAKVRFSALSRLNPVVNGTVVSISADRLTDARTGMPYYKGRIEVSPEEFKSLSYEKIVPGMPADVVIKTGEHSVLHYLLKPILDHIFTAFRER